MKPTLNITCETDVVLNVRLIHKGDTFDPSLSADLEAFLISGLGKRTAVKIQIVDNEAVVTVPWVNGRHAGLHGLEIRGKSNGLRWATVADGIINYTRTTVPGTTDDVTVSSDAYEITMEVSYRFGESPIAEVNASVDNSVGTPSLDVSYVARVLNLAFHNIRGNGIADISKITDNDGDSALNTWRVLLDNGSEFFINLRNGSRGNGIESITPVTVSEEDGGVSIWRITETDGRTIDIAVRNGRTGATGPQGASAVFDPETGNVLATLENQKGQSDSNAMTQKAVTDELNDNIFAMSHIVDTKDPMSYSINANGTFGSSTSYKHSAIKVKPGEKYIVENYGSSDSVRYAFVTTKAVSSGGDIPVVDNTSIETVAAGTFALVTIPVGCEYLIYNDGGYSARAYRYYGRVLHANAIGWSECTGMAQKAITMAVVKMAAVTYPAAINGYIHPNTGKWAIPSAAPTKIRCYLIPVTPGESYILKFTGSILSNTRFAFLTTDSFTVNDSAAYATGSEPTKPQVNEEYFLTAPTDAAYLYVYARDDSSTPQNSSLKLLKLIRDIVDEHTTAINQLTTDVAQIAASDLAAEEVFAGKRSVGAANWPEVIDPDKVLYVPIYGQSFAVNTDGGYRITNSFDSNLFKHKAPEPTNTIIGSGDTVMRALSQGSSYEQFGTAFMQIFSRLVKQYCRVSQDMLVGAYGAGDKTILELSDDNGISGENQYNVFAAGVANAATAKLTTEETAREKSCPFILYLQGEADTGSGANSCNNDKELYKERFLALKSQMQATVKAATGQTYNPVVFINTVGHTSWTTPSCGIQQAQVELAEENEDVFLIGSYYYMPRLYLNGSTNPHLTPDGKRWLAEKFAQKVFEVMFKGEDNNMLIGSGKVKGNNVILSMRVPEPPIVIDTWTIAEKPNYGFTVYADDNGDLTQLTVSAVSVRGTAVILTLANAPAAGTQLLVTYGNSVANGGNIRDNGSWRSLYKYASTENSQTSTVPQCQDGTTIVGKRYPMQSWLPQCAISITVD